MRAEFTNRSLKDLRQLDPITQKQILTKLSFYLDSPNPLHFAHPLTDAGDAGYRYRIGNYRLLFDVRDDLIVVLRIQHRRDVYRRA